MIQLNNLIHKIKKFLCKHDKVVNRWHYTHGPAGNETLHIEIEYKCKICGKLFYRYVYDPDAMKRFSKEYKERQW